MDCERPFFCRQSLVFGKDSVNSWSRLTWSIWVELFFGGVHLSITSLLENFDRGFSSNIYHIVEKETGDYPQAKRIQKDLLSTVAFG